MSGIVGLHSPGPLSYTFHRSLCLNCNYYLGYLTISHDSAGKYVAIHLILCINIVHLLNQVRASLRGFLNMILCGSLV